MSTLKNWVVDIPDFPQPGIIFRDITPILSSPERLALACEQMVESSLLSNVDVIVGVESRGFILGAAIAARYGKGFVPLRKAGKLPPPFEAMSYKLEYGEATLEIKKGSGRALVVDDVLATGGTLRAALDLSQRAGFEVIGASVLINLTFLNNMTFANKKIRSAIEY